MWRIARVAAVVAGLINIGTATADTLSVGTDLILNLSPGVPVNITYTGDLPAELMMSVSISGSVGIDDFYQMTAYDWTATVGFGGVVEFGQTGQPLCDTNSPGFCGINSNTQETALLDADTFSLTLEVFANCWVDDPGAGSCANFSLSGLSATVDIDPEGLATPLPTTLPLFAFGLGTLGLFSRRSSLRHCSSRRSHPTA